MPWGCGFIYGVGSNDRFNGPSFTAGQSDFSIWVRHFRNVRSSYGGGSSLMLSTGSTSIFSINSTGLVAAFNAGSTKVWTVDDPWPTERWVGLGIRADGSASTNEPTIFFDGEKKTNGSGLTPSGADSSYYSLSTLSVGGRAALGRVSGGLYEDFAVWNEQLTDEEFGLLEDGESPLNIRPSALVICYTLDDLSNHVCDVSGLPTALVASSTYGVFYGISQSDQRVQAAQVHRHTKNRTFIGITAAGGPTIRDAIDYLFANDARLALRQSLITDSMLATDSRASSRQSLATDPTYITDSSYRDVSRLLRENPLLSDRVFRAIELLARDLLLLGWSVDATTTTGGGGPVINTVSETDKLLTNDYAMKSLAMITREFLLLLDLVYSASGREQAVAVTDKIFVHEQSIRELIKSTVDPVLFNENITKLVQLLGIDLLLFLVSVSRSVTVSGAAYITWASVKSVLFLGATRSRRDILGRRLDPVDLLGRSLGNARST